MSTLHFTTDLDPTFSFDLNTDFEWTQGADGRLIGCIQRSEKASKILKCLAGAMKCGALVNSDRIGVAHIEKIGPWEGDYCEIVLVKHTAKV